MGAPPKPNFSSIAAKLRADLEKLEPILKRKKASEVIVPSPSAPLAHPSIKKLKVFTSHTTSPRSCQTSPSVSSPVSIVYHNNSSPREPLSKPFSKKSNKNFRPVEILSDSLPIESSNHSYIESSSDPESVKNVQLSSSENILCFETADSNFSNSIEEICSSQDESEDLNFISISNISDDNNILTKNQPWFRSGNYSIDLSATERLNKEVESVVEYLSPTDKEIKLRKWVFSHVKKAANTLWPTATVHMFGSFSTRLFIPTSDIDIVVIIPDLVQKDLVHCLTALHSTINGLIGFSKSEIRKKAKIPIINFVEQITGLEVDININASSGIDSCHIVTSFIRQCPAIRPLNMVLKHFLELNDLNKVFTGGLSSYALTLLIVNFLQIHPFVRSGQIDPMANLGVLLVEFLELYGVCFNSNHVGITLTNGGRYYRRSTLVLFQKHFSSVSLELLDPQDESNNVASGSFNYEAVQTSFKKAYATISDNAARYCLNAKGTSFLEPLLGKMLHIPSSTMMMRESLNNAYRQIFLAEHSS